MRFRRSAVIAMLSRTQAVEDEILSLCGGDDFGDFEARVEALREYLYLTISQVRRLRLATDPYRARRLGEATVWQPSSHVPMARLQVLHAARVLSGPLRELTALLEEVTVRERERR